jgi:phosphate transport system substrate-binding protein
LKLLKKFARILTAIALLCLAASAPASAQTTVLVGAGSTVPQPLYVAWSEAIQKSDSTIQLRYLPMGAADGVQQVSKGSGDFGAGEIRLTAAELKKSGLTMIPVAVVGIVPIYNVPGLHNDLQFNGDVLAGIFLGDIKTWSDPKIAKLNPGVKLPDLAIKVVHRPDGKGSNYIFSTFLSKENAAFKERVGASASPKWPVGTKAERSSDMVDSVKQTAGAIGYVEHSFAVKNGVGYAAVKNAAGQTVKASKASLQAAEKAAESATGDEFSTLLTDTTVHDAYPISSFTWMYVRAKSGGNTRAAAQIKLLQWILGDGQKIAEDEGYVALSTTIQGRVRHKVDELK